MVQSTRKLFNFRIPRKHHQNWIDSLRILCKAGSGGHGTPQYGGQGGQGGSIYIKVYDETNNERKLRKQNTNLLQIFKKEFKGDPKNQRLIAKSGGNSCKARLNGEEGMGTTLMVPPGISVTDEFGNIECDLNTPGQKYIAARGGNGGSKLTNWIGLPGQKRFIRLDLRLLADIGLVGFPNAGKSTLLNALSNAKPRIASFPFTTLRPNLGHLEYPDLRSISMADLPGLIEGSHKNLGMGHRFLKHVERTKLLLFVIDVNGFQLGPEYEYRNAFENLVLLNKELELYNPDLLKKPCVLAINKMDTPKAKSNFQHFEQLISNDKKYEQGLENIDEEMWPNQKLEFKEILTMSAQKDQKSVSHVKNQLRFILDQVEDQRQENETQVELLSQEVDAILETNVHK